MKYELEDTSNLTRWCPIINGKDWEIEVAAVSREQREDLAERCSTDRFVGGRMQSEVNWEMWNLEAPKLYIRNWRGCKPEHIALLGLRIKNLQADSDGCVPFDMELAQFLWRRVPLEKFMTPIQNYAHEVVALREREKAEDEKN